MFPASLDPYCCESGYEPDEKTNGCRAVSASATASATPSAQALTAVAATTTPHSNAITIVASVLITAGVMGLISTSYYACQGPPPPMGKKSPWSGDSPASSNSGRSLLRSHNTSARGTTSGPDDNGSGNVQEATTTSSHQRARSPASSSAAGAGTGVVETTNFAALTNVTAPPPLQTTAGTTISLGGTCSTSNTASSAGGAATTTYEFPSVPSSDPSGPVAASSAQSDTPIARCSSNKSADGTVQAVDHGNSRLGKKRAKQAQQHAQTTARMKGVLNRVTATAAAVTQLCHRLAPAHRQQSAAPDAFVAVTTNPMHVGSRRASMADGTSPGHGSSNDGSVNTASSSSSSPALHANNSASGDGGSATQSLYPPALALTTQSPQPSSWSMNSPIHSPASPRTPTWTPADQGPGPVSMLHEGFEPRRRSFTDPADSLYGQDAEAHEAVRDNVLSASRARRVQLQATPRAMAGAPMGRTYSFDQQAQACDSAAAQTNPRPTQRGCSPTSISSATSGRSGNLSRGRMPKRRASRAAQKVRAAAAAVVEVSPNHAAYSRCPSAPVCLEGDNTNTHAYPASTDPADPPSKCDEQYGGPELTAKYQAANAGAGSAVATMLAEAQQTALRAGPAPSAPPPELPQDGSGCGVPDSTSGCRGRQEPLSASDARSQQRPRASSAEPPRRTSQPDVPS